VQGAIAEPSTADPGDVEQDVEASAQDVQGKLEESRDFPFALSELEREFPNRPERGELIERRAIGLGRAPCHNNARPLQKESAGRGQTDPAGPSNDQTSAAVEPAGT